MILSVAEVAQILEEKGLLKRRKWDESERLIDHIEELLDRPIPEDLKNFYRQRIEWVGEFHAIFPTWNRHVGWRPASIPMTELLPAQAAPLFFDGFGNIYGLDLSSASDPPAVYFFDDWDLYERPHYAAGSSLGRFLLLLAEQRTAFDEGRSAGWELEIDPDIEKCPRAPALWNAPPERPPWERQD